jgi:hypothetical protein
MIENKSGGVLAMRYMVVLANTFNIKTAVVALYSSRGEVRLFILSETDYDLCA